MQFALMIYHTPEEFARHDPHLGAWRAYYKALVEAGVYIGANALEVPVTQERRCVFRRKSAACRMAPMPTRRSN